MLIHPVITKYLTAPHASIVRVVDLFKWIQTQEFDWDKVYTWLDKAGLKTAAWVTAQWLKMITGKTLPESFIRQTEPSGPKKRYLQNWINKNYSTKFLEKPFLIKTLFTLPVHDTITDAFRAVRTLQHEKKIAQSETKKLQSAINK